MPESIINDKDLGLDRYDGNIFVVTMRKAPENRLNVYYAQKLISAFGKVRQILGTGTEGAVITRGNDEKFWCTVGAGKEKPRQADRESFARQLTLVQGLELEESDTNPWANAEGFFPLLATIVDFPFPTIALVTGHTFGGACPFALSHDYRVMNSKRGFFSMPPVNLGLHFPGIGTLPRLKLHPQVARKMLLEAHRWTGEEALEDGIVDAIAGPDRMFEVAMDLAKQWAPKAKMDVYSTLRQELYGEAAKNFREISYNYGRRPDGPAKAKI